VLYQPPLESMFNYVGMFRKQPGLRYFAVLQLKKSTKYGHLWEVQDRRSSQATQFLFQPSLLTSWPRWVAILGEKCIPTRLRNGKVALLLNREITFEESIELLKTPRNRERYELSPMRGFVKKSSFPWKPIVVSSFAVAIAACLLVVRVPMAQTQVVAKQVLGQRAPVVKCGEVDLVGADIPNKLKVHINFRIGRDSFRIVQLKSFGGLTQIYVKRTCDGKRLTLNAWREKESLKVSRVN
jgi:hypothetical protein